MPAALTFPRPALATPSRRFPSAAGAAVAAAAAVVLVAAFGGVQPRWYLPVYAVLYLAAAAALVLAQVRWRWLFLPLLLTLALPLLQLALGSSADPAATQTGFLHLAAPAAAFLLVLLAAAGPGAADRLWFALALLAGLLAAEALLQYFLAPQAIFGLFPIAGASPVGSFVNHNDFVAAIELTFPALLLRALRPRQPLTVTLAWSWLAALALAAAVIGGSRGGAIGTAVEILLLAAWYAARRRGPSRAPLGAAAGAAALLLVFAFATGLGPLVRHFRQSEPSARMRFSLDRSSLAMGAARPLLGQGLGAWTAVYPRFARFDDGLLYTAAHDEYAQWWAETGLLGALCALALAALWAAAARPGWPYPPAAAGAIAVIGFSTHATVDFLGHIPALAVLFAIAAALALAPPPTLPAAAS